MATAPCQYLRRQLRTLSAISFLLLTTTLLWLSAMRRRHTARAERNAGRARPPAHGGLGASTPMDGGARNMRALSALPSAGAPPAVPSVHAASFSFTFRAPSSYSNLFRPPLHPAVTGEVQDHARNAQPVTSTYSDGTAYNGGPPPFEPSSTLYLSPASPSQTLPAQPDNSNDVVGRQLDNQVGVPDVSHAQTVLGSPAPLRPSRDEAPRLFEEYVNGVHSLDVAVARLPPQVGVPFSSGSDTARAPAGNVWSVEGHLGGGAFGHVFLVQDDLHCQQAALKVIYCRMSAHSCRSVVSELETLATLAKHRAQASARYLMLPHESAGSWAWQSSAGFVHIAMDLCPGGDLRTYPQGLKRSQLRVVIAEIVVGLRYLHDLGIVHHDIKPDNILISADGHCVISDFGGARRMFTEGQRVGMLMRDRDTRIIKTVQYAAPELLAPVMGPSYYTEAVDYWSLGAVISALITRKLHFSGRLDTLRQDLKKLGQDLAAMKVSQHLMWLIYDLLSVSDLTRVGRISIEVEPYFWGLDWEMVRQKRVPPPLGLTLCPQTKFNESAWATDGKNHNDLPNILPDILRQEGLVLELDDSLDVFEAYRDPDECLDQFDDNPRNY
ncbi:hypothetical protein CERSUDRAFT_123898 [Gelatoporia subvermispora B]|uniref:Protein kinase domain-containing protein n=1 Tax=Ceriporiopsis subvermispora (strain B) TaxID=914234 RepID=M2QXM4_CERS8|nr:hypothetical protein CERSUDRAFT_123898 [Gelatoporia subvermispora B]